MPSSSKKQHNFMAAIAHSPSFAKKVGVSQSVGKDFNAADKGKTFNKGGMMKTRKFATAGFVDDSDMDDEGNTRSKYEIDPDSRRAHGLYDETPAPKKAAAPRKARKTTFRGGQQGYDEAGQFLGGQRGFSESGSPYRAAASEKTNTASKRVEELQSIIDRVSKESTAKMKQGGSVMKKPNSLFKGKETYGEELKEAKAIKSGKISPKQYASGEESEKPKKFAKGGGIESRGKTKGTIIRMASGGSVSSASRRADGIAQRGKTRC